MLTKKRLELTAIKSYIKFMFVICYDGMELREAFGVRKSSSAFTAFLKGNLVINNYD